MLEDLKDQPDADVEMSDAGESQPMQQAESSIGEVSPKGHFKSFKVTGDTGWSRTILGAFGGDSYQSRM